MKDRELFYPRLLSPLHWRVSLCSGNTENFRKSCPPLSQKLENLLHDVRSASRPIHWSTNLQIHVNIRHLPTRKVIVIPLWRHLRWRGLCAIAIGGLQGCLHLGHKLYMCLQHCTSCKIYFELAKKDCLSVSLHSCTCALTAEMKPDRLVPGIKIPALHEHRIHRHGNV